MKYRFQLSDNRVSVLSALILFTAITFSLPLFPGLTGDIACWKTWSTYILKNGVGHAYGSGSNYMPLYHYFLWMYAKIVGSPEAIIKYIPYLRTVTVLFDFWGLWMVYKWGKLKLSYAALMIISVVNVAYYYNSVIWGQVDGIVATLVFAMLYAGWKRNFLLSGIACVLAVNMKLQAIIFVPVWGILMLDAFTTSGALKKLGVMLGSMVLAQILVLLPYMMVKGAIGAAWNTAINSTEMQPVLSNNADNFWNWIVEIPYTVWDTAMVTNNLSYRNAGLLLFFISSFFVLLPLLLNLFRRLSNGVKDEPPLLKEKIWLTAALIGLLFFFFNTQMHERYSHYAFIFITVYAFSKRRFIPYILFSVAYFLNLDAVLEWFRKDDTQRFFVRQGGEFVMMGDQPPLLFRESFIALLFAATIVYLYVLLIRKEKSAVPVMSVPVAAVVLPAAKKPSKKIKKK